MLVWRGSAKITDQCKILVGVHVAPVEQYRQLCPQVSVIILLYNIILDSFEGLHRRSLFLMLLENKFPQLNLTISLDLELVMVVSSNGLVCEMVTSPSPYCLRVMVSLSIRGAHATAGPPTINNNNRTAYNKQQQQQHLLQ